MFLIKNSFVPISKKTGIFTQMFCSHDGESMIERTKVRGGLTSEGEKTV